MTTPLIITIKVDTEVQRELKRRKDAGRYRNVNALIRDCLGMPALVRSWPRS